MSASAFPLSWPAGRPRAKSRTRSKFDTGFTKARDGLIQELSRLGARDEILSSNLALRLDGVPKSGQAQPADPGVAVYFTYRGKAMCFACDAWDKVEHNIHAVAKTIEAMRGIVRWGTGDMMDRAFSGFAALPAPTEGGKPWQAVFNIESDCRPDPGFVELRYRELAKQRHPDTGGSATAFSELTRAREEALREIKG